MADDIKSEDENEIENEEKVEQDSKDVSESELAEAKEELLTQVVEENKDQSDAAVQEEEIQAESGGQGLDEIKASESDEIETEIEPSSDTHEESENAVSTSDEAEDFEPSEAAQADDTEKVLEEDSPEELEAALDTAVEGEEVTALVATEPSSEATKLDKPTSEDEDSGAEAQAVIALKADSRLYIYGEPEDPMVGVTQNIDRARDLMLETMAKSRATTADSVKKARNLNLISGLFLCSALLGAIGFFVFMSVQMSQKIVEIDSLLTAVAKRSIQMTKGIEKFSMIEEQLDKTLVNQETISGYLAKDDPFRTQINERIEELRSQLKKDMSARVNRSEGNLSKVLDGVAASSNSNEEAIKRITSMVSKQGNPNNSIRELQRSLGEIEEKLNDLYLIEQARVSREISLQRNREAAFDAGGGLE